MISDTLGIAIVGSFTTIASGILAVIVAKMNNVKGDVRTVKGIVTEMKAEVHELANPSSYFPPTPAREPTRNAD